MSDAFILRAGGGGGLSANAAVLHVQAPVGSTITFSKNDVVVKVLGPEKSHINADNPDVADWYYSISSSNYGTWTVEASLSGDTDSKTITVSNNEQYDISLSYKLWLYDRGVISTAAGNFIRASTSINGWANGTLTNGSTTIKGSTGSGNYVLAISTNNAVDLTDYNHLVFNVVNYAAGTSVNVRSIVILNSNSFDWNGSDSNPGNHFTSTAWVNGTGIVTLDISSYHSTYYVGFAMRGQNITIEANEIYLSKE